MEIKLPNQVQAQNNRGPDLDQAHMTFGIPSCLTFRLSTFGILLKLVEEVFRTTCLDT